MTDKLLVLLGACGVHLSIGSVYAWSVLTKPIASEMGWSISEITFTFSIAIFFLGTSAGLLGNKVQKWGVSKSIMYSMMFFCGGLLLSYLSLLIRSLPLLYIGYGVIGGIGLGIGYISPVATLLKWFPEKKGFAGGCAVMAFGFAAAIASPAIQYMIDKFQIQSTFFLLALIYAFIMGSSILMIKPAPEEKSITKIDAIEPKKYNVRPNEAIKTEEFILLWIAFFINITCGIALLSIASPMAQELGVTPLEAALFVSLIGITNGGGRILFASISDYIGRPLMYILFFIMEIVAFIVLKNTMHFAIFQLAALIIIACYGGGFSCMPAYLADIFGMKYLSAIHGRILTAWGFAGLAGPFIITKTYEYTGSYEMALQFFIVLFIINTFIAIRLWKRMYL